MTDFDSRDRIDADQQDRLIDLSLRELLSGEAPPDLTDRILAAAQPVEPNVTDLMRNGKSTWFSRSTFVRCGAVAATLMVLAGALTPFLKSLRKANTVAELAAAHQRRGAPQVAATPLTDAMLEPATTRGHNEWKALEGVDRPTAQQVTVAHQHMAGVPITGQAWSYAAAGERPGSAEAGGNDRLRARRLRGTAAGGDELRGKNNVTFFEGQTKAGERSDSGLQMMVTPHVIVQEEAEERLPMSVTPLNLVPAEADEGSGPGLSGDQYSRIVENPFVVTGGSGAVSTFSIDVDTASYANVRQFLMQSRMLPPPDAVRIEELINYFDYNYDGPTDDHPFAAHVEVASCPWHAQHQLVRVALKGRELASDAPRPLSNLVFLVDVSGSMNQPNKLPLVVEGLRYLTRELGENDRVAIVVYAGSEGLALPSTPATEQRTITAALDDLRAGGSTAGGAGIRLAYQVAAENFIKSGVNRVILCTDGDFNVGTTSTAELERLAESQAKDTGVFLTVLGFGRGNLNDAMMETISNKGNGNYHYIDSEREARRVLVAELSGTLVTIAKDVKIQVEFNPAQVAGYRLIGYENRMLAREDFDDDTKDAGEIGAGHTVTALYETVPVGQEVAAARPAPLKYQVESRPNEAANSDELLTVRLRYKQPDGKTSTKIEFPVQAADRPFAQASTDFRFTAAVASFGMILRGSEYCGQATFDSVLEILEQSDAAAADAYRSEFVDLVRQARSLSQLK